jgi:hypothetical protein
LDKKLSAVSESKVNYKLIKLTIFQQNAQLKTILFYKKSSPEKLEVIKTLVSILDGIMC